MAAVEMSDAAPEPSLFALEEVAFEVEGHRLLQPLSLELAAGRIYGLIGPNGSGKSTLVKILAGQQPASRGRVLFEGQRLEDWSGRAFARKVAYLPQFPPAADGMTVRELVALGRFPWHGTLGRFTERDRNSLERALKQADMLPLAERLVDSLSGGERQRAWLAMMLAQDADCLLLDEPTSALDIAHQVEVLTLVRALACERGIGIVIVLHDVNMAARHCDEILALGHGSLVAHGTPGEIMQPETLARIYGLALGVLQNPQTGEPISYIQ